VAFAGAQGGPKTTNRSSQEERKGLGGWKANCYGERELSDCLRVRPTSLAPHAEWPTSRSWAETGYRLLSSYCWHRRSEALGRALGRVYDA